MTYEELREHAVRLAGKVLSSQKDRAEYTGACVEAIEFLRHFAGSDSSFYLQVHNKAGLVPEACAPGVAATLRSYADFIESGLAAAISPRRQVQIEVVSDFLEQAAALVADDNYHQAAAAILAGAALEEFLRNWIEAESLDLGEQKPSLSTYAQVLHTKKLITVGDAKDITAWVNNRNNAAHGYFDAAGSREKIDLMVKGVNLFMRKYEKGGAAME